MEIKTIQDLVIFSSELLNKYGNKPICLTDRFTEYKLSGHADADDAVINIDCEKIGSVLQGTHRVLGGE